MASEARILISDGSETVEVTSANALKVDGSAVIQPVSGTVTITPSGTQTIAISQTGTNNDVDVASLPSNTVAGSASLPSGTNNIGDVDVLTLPSNTVAGASSLPAGTNAIGKLSANSGVDIGDVDITSVVPGTGATSLGKAEDAVHASGDTGVMILAVRKDTPENLVGAAGDYAPLQVDDLGGLRISAPNNRSTSGTLNALSATITLVGDGLGSVEWEIDTGNLVATVVFEASLDDSNWFAINGVRIDGTIISSTNAFADRGTLSPTGYSRYRLRVSAYTSGSSAARMEGALSADTVRLGQALPSGGNFVGYVGIAGAVGLAYAAQTDIYTATGNGTTIDASAAPVKYFSIQVKGTGAAATTWDVRLEGSNDNANFQQIIQHTQVTGDGVLAFAADAIARPCRYFRSRCSGLVLGGASDIVVTITGIQ